ncbi:MAG: FAD-binding oxidoreductase [Acidimicrobiales bacterium]|nr:FAD-binding oxidoreductase [Acidimicrobiales bacterium]
MSGSVAARRTGALERGAAGLVADLGALLGSGAVQVDLPSRRTASKDHAWLSPILERTLPATVVDVVASPADGEELARAVGAACRRRVPVQPRGKGTGNYGQSVPFAAGMALSTDRYATIRDLGLGWVEADAGASFARLEAAARATGQELAMFPTTMRSSLAGFLAGGAGGIGSLEHGLLWEGGFVQELEIVPCWEQPEPFTVAGDEVAPFLHAYGTTGVISGARVRLVPARRWTALFASFGRYLDAMAAAGALALLEPRPRAVSVTDAALAQTFPADERWPAGQVSVRAIVEEGTAADAAALVGDAGGAVQAVRPDGVATVVSTSFNHVTLRAKQQRPGLCHLQIAGDAPLRHPEQVRAALPGAMLHHDLFAGRIGGLLLSDFVDEDTLRNGMARLRELGVIVVDPHTWLLGGHGGLDAQWEASARFDPYGLYNPGKLPPRP